ERFEASRHGRIGRHRSERYVLLPWLALPIRAFHLCNRKAALDSHYTASSSTDSSRAGRRATRAVAYEPYEVETLKSPRLFRASPRSLHARTPRHHGGRTPFCIPEPSARSPCLAPAGRQ